MNGQWPTVEEVLALDCKNNADDLQKVKDLFQQASEYIEESDHTFLKETLAAHNKCIEARNDWDECQKSARRKLIINYWITVFGGE